MIRERILDRYSVLGVIGRGVFSSVLRCLDTRSTENKEEGENENENEEENDEESKTSDQKMVAIKLARNNDTMRKSAMTELAILQQLRDTDPHHKKFIVRLEDSGDHRNHIALVFEHMDMDLREALLKFGKNVGINVSGVRMYSRQLLVALKHVKSQKIVHADLKLGIFLIYFLSIDFAFFLDNILVSEDLRQIRLCDFGSAFYEKNTETGVTNDEITPYLVSRFYRAPEIILGNCYNHQLDLWSAACCIYELFTGKVFYHFFINEKFCSKIGVFS